MNSKKLFPISMLLLCACSVASTNSNINYGNESPDPENHINLGKSAAHPDFPKLAGLCDRPSIELTEELVASNPWTMPRSLPPYQVFDNLYFLGNSFVSAWLLKTSEGYVLIDTLQNEIEARTFIENGMISLGLNPAEIKYILITHGHGDHTGGAVYLENKYHPKIIVSKVDLEEIRDNSRGIELEGWNDLPNPWKIITSNESIKIGDTTLDLIITPGHTMGTLSLITDVKTNNQTYKSVLWGGTGFNFGPRANQYQAYANSAFAMRQAVLDRGISVFLSNHVGRDEADLKIAQMIAGQNNQQNPFILTPQRVANAFTTFGECALAQRDKIRILEK